ncbi:SEC-C metal-binding domain-containing protein [Clostridium aestuarii]|uniref:SEC-C metal-binding domain-containing protein n=1 Tax=Clostridium aestuarii TaxID=338193 RepID=A0ABT4D1X9_9CLOT|nr:SEC-C metal-binding domain-containing protein [Clostridium aestuarii]MCY6485249.1 SEC-C metal-binding domain-containing protein [Clostridium aestuarii]
MSLYKGWTDMVVDYVKHKGEAAFWKEYGQVEKDVYSKMLANHKDVIKGKIEDLAKEYDADIKFFMGFLDGINESLKNDLDIEAVEADTEIELNIDFEKLYFNMLDAKADYLYSLPQWNGILSEEKRKEITKEWRASKTVVKPMKIGRNDLCPCGSGKKYKKCCGKNA